MNELSFSLEQKQLRLLQVLRIVFVFLSVPLAVLINALYSINEFPLIENPNPISLYGRELMNPFVLFLSWVWTNNSLVQTISIVMSILVLIIAIWSVFIRDWQIQVSKFRVILGIFTELFVFGAVILANFTFFNSTNQSNTIFFLLISIIVFITLFTISLIPIGSNPGGANWEIWLLIMINCLITCTYIFAILPVDFSIQNIINIVGFRFIYLNLPIIMLVAILPALDRLTYRHSHSHWTAVLGLSLPIICITSIIFVFGSVYQYSLAKRWLNPTNNLILSNNEFKKIQVLKVNTDGSTSTEKVSSELLAINNIKIKGLSDQLLSPRLKTLQADLFLKVPYDLNDFNFVLNYTKSRLDPEFDIALISHKPLLDNTTTFEQVLKVQARLKQYRQLIPKRLSSEETYQRLNLIYEPNAKGEIEIAILDDEGFMLPDFIVGIRKSKTYLGFSNQDNNNPAINFSVIDNNGKAIFKNIPYGDYEVFFVTESIVHPLLEMFDISVDTSQLVVNSEKVIKVRFKLIPKT